MLCTDVSGNSEAGVRGAAAGVGVASEFPDPGKFDAGAAADVEAAAFVEAAEVDLGSIGLPCL